MLQSAILLTLVTIIATVDYNGPLFMIHRPLVTGAMTGLVLGDFTQGLIIGATLELMWLGVTGIGGFTPPDTIVGAIVGTGLGIMSGQGVTAGVAIAVPVAVITQQLDVLAKTATIFFVKKADDDAAKGDLSKIGMYHYLSLTVITLFKVVPVFLAIMLGGDYVEGLFNAIPEGVMTGLNVAGGIMPAIGFGMLLNMMLKKNMWVFLLVGFVAAAFGNLSTVGIALIGVIIAYFFDMIQSQKQTVVPTTAISASDDEEDYDL